MTFLTLQLVEYDSFNEREVDIRKQTYRRTISMMKETTETYDVFSTVKGWKSKKLPKKLIVEMMGKVTIWGMTEDTNDVFMLSDVHQIIWTDLSQTSNPQVTFTFKDDKK